MININNVCFGGVVGQMCPSGLQLGGVDASGTKAAFLDLHLSISNVVLSTKIYNRRDELDFEAVGFPFLDGGVPCFTSYGVFVSQLILFAGASGRVAGFGEQSGLLTQRLLWQGCGYHRLCKTFSKFYRRYYDFILVPSWAWISFSLEPFGAWVL